MNIFAVSDDPVKSAKQLANRHISRMPLESHGMLSFAFPEGSFPTDNDYKHSHFKHPASIWARTSKANFEWLLIHALAQCEEYSLRYKREHDSEKHIRWAADNCKYLSFPSESLTPFARCFSKFKEELDQTESDTVAAYRKFYWLDKKDFAKWPEINQIPEWWIEKDEKYVDKNFKNGKYTKR